MVLFNPKEDEEEEKKRLGCKDLNLISAIWVGVIPILPIRLVKLEQKVF